MYLNEITPDYQGFHRLDSPPRDRQLSSKERNYNWIAPWGNGEKILGNIKQPSNLNKQNKKSQQKAKRPQNSYGEINSFIQSPQKSRRNKFNLGKLQKSSKNNKNIKIHLNMKKIQFKQFEQNSLMQNQNKLFKTNNPKINVKDFPSLDNNFFIKSYFFPNNIKSANKKDVPQSLDQKKRKQYSKIKQIQIPAFLAIKSVNLREKFQLEENDSDETNIYPLENEDFYTTYRTISVLSSRKKSNRKVNKSMNEKYEIKNSDDQFQTYNKTLVSKKQSQKQISDSLRQRYRMVIEQKANKNKLIESNEIIVMNSSAIKRKSDEKFVSQQTKVTQGKQQVLSKIKKVSQLKQRQTSFNRSKKIKSKGDHQNLLQNVTYYVEPKSILQSKDLKIQQTQPLINDQNLISHSQSFKNQIQRKNRHKYQFKVENKSLFGDKTAFTTLNNSIF